MAKQENFSFFIDSGWKLNIIKKKGGSGDA
jgi:hypothetical protein